MVVLLMLIPLLAPQEGAPQGAAGMTRIAKALGIAAIKVGPYVVPEQCLPDTLLGPDQNLCITALLKLRVAEIVKP